MNSLDFHQLAAALHRQYRVYSSQQPSIMGCKYELFWYGLQETTYRVRHFGHSTQCRIRRIAHAAISGFRPDWHLKVVMHHIHLKPFKPNHYDPQK